MANAGGGRKTPIKGNHVGRYLFETNKNSVRFAIDSSDVREIRDPLAYEWANMYFKANWWPGFDYSERVYPIVNGNGILDSRKIELLRNLRNHQKSVDLVFISRIYTSPKHTGAKLSTIRNITSAFLRLYPLLIVQKISWPSLVEEYQVIDCRRISPDLML